MPAERAPIIRTWKEFTAPAPATRTGLYASINASGVIVLNRRAYAELGSPATVSLLYEEENLTIGLRSTGEVMPSAFPVIARDGGRKRCIRAHDFVREHSLQISYCVRFLDAHIEDNVLILDLNLTARASQNRSRRAR